MHVLSPFRIHEIMTLRFPPHPPTPPPPPLIIHTICYKVVEKAYNFKRRQLCKLDNHNKRDYFLCLLKYILKMKTLLGEFKNDVTQLQVGYAVKHQFQCERGRGGQLCVTSFMNSPQVKIINNAGYLTTFASNFSNTLYAYNMKV